MLRCALGSSRVWGENVEDWLQGTMERWSAQAISKVLFTSTPKDKHLLSQIRFSSLITVVIIKSLAWSSSWYWMQDLQRTPLLPIRTTYTSLLLHFLRTKTVRDTHTGVTQCKVLKPKCLCDSLPKTSGRSFVFVLYVSKKESKTLSQTAEVFVRMRGFFSLCGVEWLGTELQIKTVESGLDPDPALLLISQKSSDSHSEWISSFANKEGDNDHSTLWADIHVNKSSAFERRSDVLRFPYWQT